MKQSRELKTICIMSKQRVYLELLKNKMQQFYSCLKDACVSLLRQKSAENIPTHQSS